jgi:hypothetical protein
VSPDPSARRDRTRLIVAAVVALVGLGWVAQGLGVPIGGGFMVGDRFWTYAGAALVAVAVLFAAWPRLRGRRGR